MRSQKRHKAGYRYGRGLHFCTAPGPAPALTRPWCFQHASENNNSTNTSNETWYVSYCWRIWQNI